MYIFSILLPQPPADAVSIRISSAAGRRLMADTVSIRILRAAGHRPPTVGCQLIQV
jgi:hypothetical protein